MSSDRWQCHQRTGEDGRCAFGIYPSEFPSGFATISARYESSMGAIERVPVGPTSTEATLRLVPLHRVTACVEPREQDIHDVRGAIRWHGQAITSEEHPKSILSPPSLEVTYCLEWTLPAGSYELAIGSREGAAVRHAFEVPEGSGSIDLGTFPLTIPLPGWFIPAIAAWVASVASVAATIRRLSRDTLKRRSVLVALEIPATLVTLGALVGLGLEIRPLTGPPTWLHFAFLLSLAATGALFSLAGWCVDAASAEHRIVVEYYVNLRSGYGYTMYGFGLMLGGLIAAGKRIFDLF
jgi:hypothetical protein